MKEEITLTNKFSYEKEVQMSYFANTYNKLSCFGYKMCHSKMKCEKVILNNYEEYYMLAYQTVCYYGLKRVGVRNLEEL